MMRTVFNGLRPFGRLSRRLAVSMLILGLLVGIPFGGEFSAQAAGAESQLSDGCSYLSAGITYTRDINSQIVFRMTSRVFAEGETIVAWVDHEVAGAAYFEAREYSGGSIANRDRLGPSPFPASFSYAIPRNGTYDLGLIIAPASSGSGTFGLKCSSADADDDGVPDSEDAFPNSDTAATVIIDGCDSGVSNPVLENGATFSDLIGEAAMNAKNHGQFVRAVSSLANEWKSMGLITGEDKGAIVACAAQSNIP